MKGQETEKKISWDEIPSLADLSVDWEYQSTSIQDQRAFPRLNASAVSQLVESQTIEVRLATATKNYTGTLVDISAGGIAVQLSAQLAPNTPVKVGFFIGTTKIISRGVVRHARVREERVHTGIMFIDLAPDLVEYIAGLYAAKVLNRIS